MPIVPPASGRTLEPSSPVTYKQGRRGTTTNLLQKICHDKIHSVFTEMELKRHYNTIEKLKEHEEISSFLKWVAKKEPQFYDRSVRKKR